MSYIQWVLICRFMVVVLKLLSKDRKDQLGAVSAQALIDDIAETSTLDWWGRQP
jgi:hypothetical protein